MHAAEKPKSSRDMFNQGLVDNSLKLMDGKYGGAFYVKYYFNKMNGFGFLNLILEYPKGEVVAIPLCKNVCKIIEHEEESDGVGTAPLQYPADAPSIVRKQPPPIITPRLKDSGCYGEYSKFIRYERPDFPIPMDVIWSRIIELWRQIPMENWSRTFTYEEVYQALIELGEDKDEKYRDAYCVYLTRREVEEVAERMGYTFLVIRNVFESRNLWKKDANSLGYQFSKKVDKKNERFYALKRLGIENGPICIETKYAIEYKEKLEKAEIKSPQVN